MKAAGPLRVSSMSLLLLILLHVISTEARMFNFFSYTTMMGLAAQSSRWKTKMEGELTLVAKKSAEATALQEAATEDQAAADELTKKITTEQEEATALQEEADGLFTKAEVDEAKAGTTEEEAEGMTAQATENQAQSAALFVEAAAEEAVAEEDAAQATADAAIAAQDAAEAEADEATTAVCQFIPLVDVACDVVGGVAAVALEAQSVRFAALAAENFAAAAAAQAEADSTAAEATELQATAAEEGEQAEVLQSGAAALEADASEELELAETDESAAEEELAQSTLDEAAAAEEQTKAITEEDASGKAWQDSVHHGANACGKALMMSVVSAVSLLFWLLRIVGSVVMPVLKSTCGYVWNLVWFTGKTDANKPFTAPTPSDIWVGGSYMFHHGLLFVLAFGLWGDTLLRLPQMASIKAMGGTILGFAASVAASQSVLLHSVSRMVQHDGTSLSCLWVGGCEFARRMLVLCPLVIMEMLLAWVNAGRWVFIPSVVQHAQSLWLWGLLAVSLTIHYCVSRHKKNVRVEYDTLATGDYGNGSTDSMIESEPLITSKVVDCNYESIEITIDDDDDSWEPIDESKSEATELLSYHTQALDTASSMSEKSETGFLVVLMGDIRRIRLLLVFEVLMASIILAFLLQSTPMLQMLWPASKAILLAAHPQWRLMSCLSAIAALVLVLCACI